MSPSTARPAKTYFIQRGTAELGPFTLAQINRMRSRNEIAATDLCRPSDASEFHPLVALFPHMATFVNKSREQHKKEAETTEGNSLANTALVCGVLSWFFVGLVLGGFAVVLGIKSLLRVRRPQAVIGVILGGWAVLVTLLHTFKPMFR